MWSLCHACQSNGKRGSIWGRYLDELDNCKEKTFISALYAFLAITNKKMGENSIIKLLLDDDGNGRFHSNYKA